MFELERENQVQNIWIELGKLEEQKAELQKIDSHLKLTRKGQKVYLQVETVVGTALMVGIVIGSYRAYFPPGFRAMLSAYLTTNAISRGFIKLSEKEVTQLLSKIALIDKQITVLEKKLHEQKTAACKQIEYFFLCDIY